MVIIADCVRQMAFAIIGNKAQMNKYESIAAAVGELS